jgi:ribosomal protein S18 acetylase RimI-like enzyme
MDMMTRWMIVADLPQVVAIESQCFEDAMNADQIREYLRVRNNIGMVAVDSQDSKILGYIIYELLDDRFEVLRLAVDLRHQRQGVGKALLRTIERKLTPERRRRICIMVNESMLPTHLFLRATGYRATSIQGNEYYFFKGVTWNSKGQIETSPPTSTSPSKQPRC